MKTRVTFRLPDDLADGLRALPNQTQFVEAALREALGATCQVCAGTGRVTGTRVRLSDFREHSLSRPTRDVGLQLKDLVRLGDQLAASDLELSETARGLGFTLRRDREVLLEGVVSDRIATTRPH